MSIFFEWEENMSVGEETIDSQHKKLLAQVNKIINALAFGVHSKELEEVIKFFDEYIKEHFAYEEGYMSKIGYPKIEEHKKLHHNFFENYIKFKKEFEQNLNKDILAADIERYIGDWWLEHIGKEDKKYRLFVESKKS
ncbi:MAG: hemerythrin family protein [Candidatus Paceibacterota bacterium]|jgi:hemerythrin